MWWPHGSGEWGLVISILAVVLAFPLSLLANLLTPRIRNWAAERSLITLVERVGNIERELKTVENAPVISDGEERILRALIWIGYIVTQLIGLVIVVMGALFTYAIKGNIVGEKYLNQGIVGIMLLMTGVQLSIMTPTLDFLRKRARTSREALQKELATLKMKLNDRKARQAKGFQKSSFQ